MIYLIRKDYGCEGFNDVAFLKSEELIDMDTLRNDFFRNSSLYPRLDEIEKFVDMLKEEYGLVELTNDELELVVFDD